MPGHYPQPNHYQNYQEPGYQQQPYNSQLHQYPQEYQQNYASQGQEPGSPYGQQAPVSPYPSYGVNGFMHPADVSATPKSWVVALLLCFFVGGWGIHNFYMGYVGRGIAQAVLTLGAGFSFFFGMLFFPFLFLCILFGGLVGIWAFVDFIMLLLMSDYRDSRGIPLQR